jgi:hypothetical protein
VRRIIVAAFDLPLRTAQARLHGGQSTAMARAMRSSSVFGEVAAEFPSIRRRISH